MQVPPAASEGGTSETMPLTGPRRKSELKIDIEGLPEGKSHVNVLCFDLVYFTRPAQFIILSTGVFFFYLLYGYYQELIFSLPGFTGYGWYLTLIQFGYYTVFGKVGGGGQWSFKLEVFFKN